jgi:thiosulfate/3-mercaptopyruvate sulfurtransferase
MNTGFKKIIRAILLSALFASLISAPAQADEFTKPSSTLVNTTWLKNNLSNPDLVLLHVSAEDGTYERGHIQGARKIIWKSELANMGAATNKNGIVSQRVFTNVAKKLGISTNSVVVLYGEKSQLQATWGFWVFKLYGSKNIYLLDGGLPKWVADGEATTLAVPAAAKAGSFVATSKNIALRAELRDVLSAVNSTKKNKAVIVDSRAVEQFLGQSSSTNLGNAAQGGHIPTAKSLPTSGLLNANGTFRSKAEIKAAYAAAGVDGTKQTILYCGTGLLASAAWFALTQILEYPNVKNYDGSWFEYAGVAGAPVEK